MKIGFAGTQKGMTFQQRQTVYNLLFTEKPEEVHHGDCIGADEDFHDLAGFLHIKRIIHPPIKSIKRAFCKGEILLPAKDYLPRDYDIVDETDFLIATPKEYEEQLRSGTWTTIRYCHKKLKACLQVMPNGKIYQ